MKNLQKTLLISGGIIAGVAMASGMFAHKRDANTQTAIEKGDYSALSSEMKKHISEEKFEKMSARQKTRNAVRETFEKNDYQAFLAIPNNKAIKRINNQEAFNKAVQKHNERKAHREALTQAIKNNDFDTFEKIRKERKAKHQPTTEQKKQKFAEIVKTYQETGKLPHPPKHHKRNKGAKKPHHNH